MSAWVTAAGWRPRPAIPVRNTSAWMKRPSAYLRAVGRSGPWAALGRIPGRWCHRPALRGAPRCGWVGRAGRRPGSSSPRGPAAEGARDVAGLAGSVASVPASRGAAVEFDQAVDQLQAAAAFFIGCRALANWPASAVVVYFGPQVTFGGTRQAHLDLARTVHDGIGYELAHDQLGDVGVLAKPPAGKRLTGLLAGAADLERISVQPVTHTNLTSCGHHPSQLLRSATCRDPAAERSGHGN